MAAFPAPRACNLLNHFNSEAAGVGLSGPFRECALELVRRAVMYYQGGFCWNTLTPSHPSCSSSCFGCRGRLTVVCAERGQFVAGLFEGGQFVAGFFEGGQFVVGFTLSGFWATSLGTV